MPVGAVLCVVPALSELEFKQTPRQLHGDVVDRIQ